MNRFYLFLFFILFTSLGFAEPDLRSEYETAFKNMLAARLAGPADIPLLDQAKLDLPEGFTFIPNPEARRFMQAVGNPVGDNFLGLIWPQDEKAHWIVTVSFEKSGYIRDEDAKDWKIDEMLEHLKQGTLEMNKARAERGVRELEVIGWAEAPNYDVENHRLIWSLAVQSKDAAPDEKQSVNYNTYALGREGYISLNLVTSLNEIEDLKPVAQTLLASLSFDEGKRYADYDPEKDHLAEYGLAALVGGVVAKKLGLFAMAALFLGKFGKILAVFAMALFGFFGKRFSRKKTDSTFEA